MNRVSVPEVNCKVKLECGPFNTPGSATTTSLDSVCLSLKRNQFHDLLLSLEDLKSGRSYSYAIMTTGGPSGIKSLNTASISSYNVKVHGNFISEGKASLVLTSPVIRKRIQVMISNAAPSTLSLFVNSFGIKSVMDNQKNKENQIPTKERLLAMKRPVIDQISPVTVTDVKKVRRVLTESGQNSSPKSSRMARLGPDTKPRVMKSVPSLNTFFSRITVTIEQKRVVDSILAGKSIFFTGSAGCGKSFLLKHITSLLPPDTTAVTASTGLAASHINGMTVHTFAGIGSGIKNDVDMTVDECVALINSNQCKKNVWKRTRVLIIDEISMIDSHFFDKLESIARIVKNVNAPFGGIQLILCGDFFQLPPVQKFKKGDSFGNQSKSFCFKSAAWSECIDELFNLRQVQRQKGDVKFIQLLEKIRKGICDENVVKELKSTMSHSHGSDNSGGFKAVKLCTHKNDVDAINELSLSKLPAELMVFKASDSSVKCSLQLDSYCPSPRILKLKVGSQVILSKNIDVPRGLVNGSRGIITKFQPTSFCNSSQPLPMSDSLSSQSVRSMSQPSSTASVYPVVRFSSGIERVITPETWTMKTSATDELHHRKQLPLNLGWALSIHKSQGMEVESAEISLTRVFEAGQAYVALSRVKTFAGLKVTDFTSTSIRADPQVVEFYRNLE